MTLETELKIDVPADFAMPSLDGVVEGARVRQRPTERLVAIYHDTADLRLARWGCTLRHRAPEGWTVKIPGSESGPGLARIELVVAGEPGEIPAEVSSLVVSYVRGVEVTEVAVIETRRIPVELLAIDGTLLATVTDDDSTGTRPGHDPVMFRQVEIEFTEDGVAHVDAVREVIVAAGGTVGTQIPKLATVLGPASLRPADIDVPEVSEDPTAREVIHAALASAGVHLVDHLPLARVGEDPEGVHQARVAIRRLRSDIATFGLLLDRKAFEPLSRELRWFATKLGAVRDADVLLENARGAGERHPGLVDDGFAEVIAALEHSCRVEQRRLRGHLDSARVARLLDRVVELTNDPVTAPQADDPADELLADSVRRRWKRLNKAVKKLGADPPVSDLHAVRILAKRCRYSSDAVSAAFGDAPRKLARRLGKVQDALGAINDAEIASEALAAVAASSSPEGTFAAGRIAGVLTAEAAAEAGAWQGAWKRASDAGLRGWMAPADDVPRWDRS